MPKSKRRGLTTTIGAASITAFAIALAISFLWVELIYILTGIIGNITIVNIVFLCVGGGLWVLGIFLIYRRRLFAGFLTVFSGMFAVIIAANFYLQAIML